MTIRDKDFIVLIEEVQPMKGKEFVRRLKAYGVIVTLGRGKGGHVRASFKDSWTTIPTHGSTDIDPQFLKRICKQLGIDPAHIL